MSIARSIFTFVAAFALTGVASMPAVSLEFREHVVDTGTMYAYGVFAADINNDGYVDILTASENDHKVAWWQNSGESPPTFTEQVITTSADGARSVHAADMDGDGDLDVLSASYRDGKIAWHESSGGVNPTFTTRLLDPGFHEARTIVAADLNNDGHQDVLIAASEANLVGWYANDGQPEPTFTYVAISTDAAGSRAASSADLNADGLLDVMSASAWDGKISWYSSGGFIYPTFTEHVVTRNASGADSVAAADVDGDGDLDMVSSSWLDNKIAWYENTGGAPLQFEPHVITQQAMGAAWVHPADLDADGDMDILTASIYDKTVAWYENNGAQPPTFEFHAISTTADHASCVYAADLDNDGDLDVMSVSRLDNKVAWYENLGGGLNVNVSARIEPHEPNTTDDLRCITTVENAGGYDQLDFTYRWFRDGAEILEGLTIEDDFYPVTGPALSSFHTAKNESYFCLAGVSDGDLLKEIQTASVFVQNSPPLPPVVEIRPAEPRPGQDLGINIVRYSVDPDGDEVDYRIDWYESEDGGETWIHKVELVDAAFISGDVYIEEGDLWRVEITPYEVVQNKGNGDMTMGEAGWDQVYIGDNSRPEVIVTQPAAGDVAIAYPHVSIAWQANDADGDAVHVDLYYDRDGIKGNSLPIAMGQAGTGEITWTVPNAPDETLVDFTRDGTVDHEDLFRLALMWQEEPEGTTYRVFARAWDSHLAMGEGFSAGEFLVPFSAPATLRGLLAVSDSWHTDIE